MRDAACPPHYDNACMSAPADKARAPARRSNSKEGTAEDSIRTIRRVWPSAIRATTAVAAMAAVALVAGACGGSPGSHVAQLGTTSHSAISSTVHRGASNEGGAPPSQPSSPQPLDFSHCMRSHGVPNFPDPNGSGVWPKTQVELAASGNPRFQGATDACGHLLPDGGPGVLPSPAVVQQIAEDMVKFTRCMRSHGVPNWPNYTLDQGRAVFDPQAAGIDPNSPQVNAKMQECVHVFPASVGLPPGA
jgi:hypothetical protein